MVAECQPLSDELMCHFPVLQSIVSVIFSSLIFSLLMVSPPVNDSSNKYLFLIVRVLLLGVFGG